MFRYPAFGLAEVTWRWSLGLAGLLVSGFALIEYLATLPVSQADLLLLKSRQPALMAKSLSRILQGSGARVVETTIVAVVFGAMAWIIVGGLGRMATLKALFGHFRESSATQEIDASGSARSLFALNFFRVAALLAASVASFAPGIAVRLSAVKKPDPGLVFFALLGGVGLIGCAWCMVNWFLSLASVFVVARGKDAFGAMESAVDLCRRRFGAVTAVSSWFGLAHLSVFMFATFLSLFTFGLLGVLPGALVLLVMALLALAYFLIADFLYVGRLAGYVAILELPEVAVRMDSPLIASPPAPEKPPSSNGWGIDPDELILSDVPV